MEEKIKLYPSNWLYNAGVVGLLRILEFGNKEDSFRFNEDGSVELFFSSFDNFENYYFEYVTKLYLLQKINFKNIVMKLDDETKKKLSVIERKLQEKIISVKSNKKINDFFLEIKLILLGEQLKKELNDLNNDVKIQEKIFKQIEEIYNSVVKFKGQANYLNTFYFNKNVVANPKGENLDRAKRFQKKYLEPIFKQTSGDELCIFCGDRYSKDTMSEFVEGDFSVLGISKDSFFNFYHYFTANGVSYNKKCALCQLILLCAFAGFNYKPYRLREIDETDYIFVNYPSFEDAFKVNNRLNVLFKNYQYEIFTDEKINPYIKSIELIIVSTKKKSRWLLQNIYFCEIKSSSRKDQIKPKFIYLNIDKSFAEVFNEFDISKYLMKLSFPYEIYKGNFVFLTTEVLKRLLEKKPVIYIAFKIFKEKIEEKDINISPIESLIFLEFLVNQKRRLNMDAKKSYGILKRIEETGRIVFSLEEIDQDKRFHIAQRFLTLIRGARKEDFYSELLRLFVVYEKQVPEKLFSLLVEDDELTFQEKALSFLTGFINPKIEDNEKIEDKKEVNNDE
jgi:CRISPR-associated protein Cst1